jgi:hypothetical protein
MSRALLPLIVVAVVGAAEPTVAGRWVLSVDAGPHGRTPMSLSLKQEGSKVTGTFGTPHGEFAVDGTFTKGELRLKTAAVEDSQPITLVAKLKADGTLDGYLSSEMGDMAWTGQREKDRP